jgi:hypothetical protein
LANEILLLLLLFQIKHWYADFKIQTYNQVLRKGIYKDPVGISHSLDHVWTTLIVLLIFSLFYTISPIVILSIALIEGLVHYHIDWIKVRYGCNDNTRPLYWTQFGLDQLAHQVTYLSIALYIFLI